MRRIRWSLIGVALWAGLLSLLLLEAIWLASVLFPDESTKPATMHAQMRLAHVVFALLYGMTRLTLLHPRALPDYTSWLAQTPWTYRKPLPLGPVTPAWQDALWIGLLTLATALHGGSPALSPSAAAFGYLLASAGTFGAMGRSSGILLFYLLGALVWVWPDPRVFVGAVILVAYAAVEHRRALAKFPPATRSIDSLVMAAAGRPAMGWPFEVLSPTGPRAPKRRLRGLAIGGLIGGWIYAGANGGIADIMFKGVEDFELLPSHSGPVAMGVIGLILAVQRLGRFCAGYPWSLGLLGRYGTGRWIDASYDVVFVAPFVSVVGGTALPWVLREPLNFSLSATIALTFVFLFWVSEDWGPTSADWHLTGGHRIAPPMAGGVGVSVKA